MFFMIGITNGRKDLPFRQTMICSRCGRYGSYTVYITFMQLLLFFIPLSGTGSIMLRQAAAVPYTN